MERDKLLDRIQKLLNLGNGTSYAGEAESALNAAEKLMKDNNLSLQDVKGHSRESVLGPLNEEPLSEKDKQYRHWEITLILAISRMFDCSVLRTSWSGGRYKKANIIVIGRQSNIITTKLMYNWIRDKIMKEARSYCDTPSSRRAYCVGVVSKLEEKVDDLKREAPKTDEWGIVPIDEVEEYTRQKHEKMGHFGLTEARIRNALAFAKGRELGDEISLDQQLNPQGIEYKKEA